MLIFAGSVTYSKSTLLLLSYHVLQSEHIGTNIFDLILNEDHRDVKDVLKRSEMDFMSRLQGMHVYV